jgi:hypothetical protein
MLLLHVRLLLLLLNDLVHKDSFVDSARGIESRSPLSISLDLMLIAHRNGTIDATKFVSL